MNFDFRKIWEVDYEGISLEASSFGYETCQFGATSLGRNRLAMTALMMMRTLSAKMLLAVKSVRACLARLESRSMM